MSRNEAPDTELLERVRQLIRHEYESAPDSSWVPRPPGPVTAEGAPSDPAWEEQSPPVPGHPEGELPRPGSPQPQLPDSGPAQPPPVPGPAGPRVLTVPSFLRASRRHIGRRALAGLLCVVLAAAVLFAVRFRLAVRDGEPVALTPTASGWGLVSRSVPPGFTAAELPGRQTGSSAATDAGGAGAATSAGGGGPPTVLVHVVGEVARPGVVVLTPGSRVTDAVAGAGGALPSADLERVNLARPVTDGEQIHVPAPGEALLPGSNGAAGGAPGVGPNGTATAAPRPVDLNTADIAELDTLPGVGPVLAQRIVEWRAQRGRFTTVEELNEVSGIGDKLFAQLKPRVTV